MRPEEIREGKIYRGRGPDRMVIWISGLRTQVQYDSDGIGDGRHYPIVAIERFAKWAKHEVKED